VTAHSLGAVRTVVAPGGFTLKTPAREYAARRGDTIALAHISSNLDAECWGADARSYNPTRAEWLDATAAVDGGADGDASVRDKGSADAFCSKGRVDEYKYTTFSQGLHKCPGEKLALVVMQCVAACLLDGGGAHQLEPLLPLPPISFERATLAQRAGPVRMRVRRAAGGSARE
jgi:cytochrome P450